VLSLNTREVHIGCILERSLKLLHRRRDFGVRGLDVAVLSDCHVGVPQDSLDDLVGNSELVKIRRQATAKRMPTLRPPSCRLGRRLLLRRIPSPLYRVDLLERGRLRSLPPTRSGVFVPLATLHLVSPPLRRKTGTLRSTSLSHRLLLHLQQSQRCSQRELRGTQEPLSVPSTQMAVPLRLGLNGEAPVIWGNSRPSSTSNREQFRSRSSLPLQAWNLTQPTIIGWTQRIRLAQIMGASFLLQR
jgi:hypothetical protein